MHKHRQSVIDKQSAGLAEFTSSKAHLTERLNVPVKSLALIIALILDCLGEPSSSWHPVVWYGKLIRYLEQYSPAAHRPRAQIFYGCLMLILATLIVLPPIWLLEKLIHRTARKKRKSAFWISVAILLTGGAIKPFFALRMLADSGRAVRIALEQNDLPAARQALQSLVSRDRSQLTAELVAAAAIESLAENLSDSVVAPLFYYSLGGLPGVALYRLYNTFDSMIGYHGQYEYIGKAAARLDDFLNWIPSRLTALAIMALAPFFGGDRKRAWQIWRRDARQTESPNAGQPMAAAAGALGLQLEKVDHYILGEPTKPIEPHDIQRAERMVWLVGGLALMMASVYQWWLQGRKK